LELAGKEGDLCPNRALFAFVEREMRANCFSETEVSENVRG